MLPLVLLVVSICCQSVASSTIFQVIPLDKTYSGDCGSFQGCYTPVNDKYVCSGNFPGSWNNGQATFTDPVGQGSSLTNLEIILIGQTLCDSSASVSATFFLNSDNLGTWLSGRDSLGCFCDAPCDSPADAPTISATINSSVTYNYGGSNIITTTFGTSNEGCYFQYNVTFTYQSSAPTPPPVAPPSPSSPSLLCCTYQNNKEPSSYNDICSSNTVCPSISNFTLVGQNGVSDCSQCSSLPVCCIYENQSNPTITTTTCVTPNNVCPPLSGFNLIGDFTVSDCQFCGFNR